MDNLYIVSDCFVYPVTLTDGDCENCAQAGEKTEGRVWRCGDSRYDLATRDWKSTFPREVCETCWFDDPAGTESTVFALAADVAEAGRLAEQCQGGAIQPDNRVIIAEQGVTLGVLHRDLVGARDVGPSFYVAIMEREGAETADGEELPPAPVVE